MSNVSMCQSMSFGIGSSSRLTLLDSSLMNACCALISIQP
jgi:hypothetical protein